MTLPLVISIPHCGTEVPADIAKGLVLSPSQVAESEDVGTREVFAGLPVLAIQAARWSRLVVDLNRDPNDLGPRGVIARADYFGRTVFKPGFEPDQTETMRRVKVYHQPYHDQLIQNLTHAKLRLLLDCHSMDAVGPADAPDPGERRAQVSLGNNGGQEGERDSAKTEITCPAKLLRAFASALETQGLSVFINQPYAGGHITRHYGAILRKQGKAAMQIELSKEMVLSPEGKLDPAKAAKTSKALLAAFKSINPLL